MNHKKQLRLVLNKLIKITITVCITNIKLTTAILDMPSYHNSVPFCGYLLHFLLWQHCVFCGYGKDMFEY